MTEIEKLVWAAVYAVEYSKASAGRQFISDGEIVGDEFRPRISQHDVWCCCHIADRAVEDLRRSRISETLLANLENPVK